MADWNKLVSPLSIAILLIISGLIMLVISSMALDYTLFFSVTKTNGVKGMSIVGIIFSFVFVALGLWAVFQMPPKAPTRPAAVEMTSPSLPTTSAPFETVYI